MRGPFGQQAVFVKEKLCSLRPLPRLRCRPYLPPNRKRNTHAMWYTSAGKFRAVFLLTRVDRVMKKKDINTFKSPSTTSRFCCFFFQHCFCYKKWSCSFLPFLRLGLLPETDIIEPGSRNNFSGPKATFEIENSWTAAQFLTHKLDNSALLTDSFIAILSFAKLFPVTTANHKTAFRARKVTSGTYGPQAATWSRRTLARAGGEVNWIVLYL